MTVIRIRSDISVILIYWTSSTGACHCPDNTRSWMASSFSGWGGCHSCRPHGDWMVVLYSIICTPHRNRHDSSSVKYVYPQTEETTEYHGLSCQCHQQTHTSTFTYKQDHANIPIIKYYWEMKDVIMCPYIQCSTWMDRCHQLLVLSKGKETNYSCLVS